MKWLCFVFFGFLSTIEGVTKASTAECIKGIKKYLLFFIIVEIFFLAAARMARKGNGSTPVSCMSCDPTHGYCSSRCQIK